MQRIGDFSEWTNMMERPSSRASSKKEEAATPSQPSSHFEQKRTTMNQINLPKISKNYDNNRLESLKRVENNRFTSQNGSQALENRGKTAGSENGRMQLGNVQPKIMRHSNVPYKPLSSNAATRPTYPSISGDENTEKRGASSENINADKHRNNLKPLRSSPQVSNITRSDENSSNLFCINHSDSHQLKDSSRFGLSFNTNEDGSGLDSNAYDKIILEYGGSFGRNNEIGQKMMVNKSDDPIEMKDSAMFNLSGSEMPLNFTFGASQFIKDPLKLNQNYNQYTRLEPLSSESTGKKRSQIKVSSFAEKPKFDQSRTIEIKKFLASKPPKLSPVLKEDRQNDTTSSQDIQSNLSNKKQKPSIVMSNLKPEILVVRKKIGTQ